MSYTILRVNKRLKNDPAFKLRLRVSSDIRAALYKNNINKSGRSSWKYLSYTPQELKTHIENQFEDWMTWENNTTYNPNTWDDSDPSTWTWQLDHIVPQSDFPYTSMEDENFKKCWALDNLRPLSSKQNLLDGVNRVRHK